MTPYSEALVHLLKLSQIRGDKSQKLGLDEG